VAYRAARVNTQHSAWERGRLVSASEEHLSYTIIGKRDPV
jgi:hypothetical protein